jgi:phenylacetic acid degradation operon negative regulatory protein
MAPHDHCSEVAELLSDLGVADFASAFVASVRVGPGLPAMVARAWDLSELGARYDAFCAGFEGYVNASLGDHEAFTVRTRLMHAFRVFAQLDPELPDELAALSGSRDRAVEIFDALYNGLAASSQRYFDSIARSTTAAGVDA